MSSIIKTRDLKPWLQLHQLAKWEERARMTQTVRTPMPGVIRLPGCVIVAVGTRETNLKVIVVSTVISPLYSVVQCSDVQWNFLTK